MIKTTYQTPELRNSNDEVVQEGAFGKNTALSNATNDGWIDYVMNDLEALHDTIGDSAPTLDGNGHVVEPCNLAIGDEDGVRLKTGYVKTSGGTVSGTLNVAQNLKLQDNQENVFGGMYVPASSATSQYLQIYGGETPSSNGGNLQLPSDGSWTLQAKNGSTAYNLVGGTDGTLKWRGNNVAVTASPAFTGTPTAPTPSATDNSTKLATTGFVNSFLNNSNTTMRFVGVNPTGAAENDTRDFWRAKGNCIAWFNTPNMLNGQPSQYMHVVSIVNVANGVAGEQVFQLGLVQPGHSIYYRGANTGGNSMNAWKSLVTPTNFTPEPITENVMDGFIITVAKTIGKLVILSFNGSLKEAISIYSEIPIIALPFTATSTFDCVGRTNSGQAISLQVRGNQVYYRSLSFDSSTDKTLRGNLVFFVN